MFNDTSFVIFLVLGVVLNIGGVIFFYYSIYRGHRTKTKRSPYGPRDEGEDRTEV